MSDIPLLSDLPEKDLDFLAFKVEATAEPRVCLAEQPPKTIIRAEVNSNLVYLIQATDPSRNLAQIVCCECGPLPGIWHLGEFEVAPVFLPQYGIRYGDRLTSPARLTIVQYGG